MTDSPMTEQVLTHSANSLDMTMDLFKFGAVGRGLTLIESRAWATDEPTLDRASADMRVLHGFSSEGSHAVYGEDGESLVWLSLSGGKIACAVSARDEEQAAQTLERILRLLPPSTPTDEKRIPLWLWTMTPHGARKARRMIDVPDWSDIRENYTASVRDELASLMGARPDAGKILLWSGQPGTGKTWALRALGYEWRKWCSLHYVVDPDVMFGQDSSYLMEVLLDGDVEGGSFEPDGLKVGVAGVPEAAPTWKLIVLEDTGEMLRADAKEHVGQALSRLLNVTDGLIGQGMRIMVLVTTNEEVGKLHPAVARSGRCAANVVFQPLTSQEAYGWLTAHDAPDYAGIPSDRTIANLYAVAEGHTPAVQPGRTGFLRTV